MAEANDKSFHSFLSRNYVLSDFVMPSKKPSNDSLSAEERERLKELMNDNDYYEINNIIRSRYEF